MDCGRGRPIDSQPIDVVMCTWNSSKPYFRRCLSSIKREVDVHHFVVVDGDVYHGALTAFMVAARRTFEVHDELGHWLVAPDNVIVRGNAVDGERLG